MSYRRLKQSPVKQDRARGMGMGIEKKNRGFLETIESFFRAPKPQPYLDAGETLKQFDDQFNDENSNFTGEMNDIDRSLEIGDINSAIQHWRSAESRYNKLFEVGEKRDQSHLDPEGQEAVWNHLRDAEARVIMLKDKIPQVTSQVLAAPVTG